MFEASRFLFQINTGDLSQLEAFPYCGRTISYNNIDWMAVYQTLKKSQRRWGVILRVLVKTESMVRACRLMYKAVAQSVIL